MPSLMHLLFIGLGAVALAEGPAFADSYAWAASPTPPALATVRKVITVRLVDGTPVAGLQVQLAPAAPDAGGPEPGTPAQTALTDATGQASFTGLGPSIWLVSFAGTVQERALAPVAGQGQPPYGANPLGGGFPVQVEWQEEDAAPTPVVIAGIVQPEQQPTSFVLDLVDGVWLPTWDLAAPAETPQPGVGPVALSAPNSVRGMAGVSNTGSNGSNAVIFWATLGLAGLLLVAGMTLLRRQERQARAARRNHS